MGVPGVDVVARLHAVRAAVVAAAVAAGRAPGDVKLVAVSKGQPAEAVRAAWQAGQRDFGENYAGELAAKRAALADLDGLVWHFIGRVQRGNAKVIATADVVHGVGSLSQAEALAKEARRRASPLDVLLQVNVADEDTKNGLAPDDVPAVAAAVSAMPTLRLCGLMAMPHVEGEALERAYERVAALRSQLTGAPRELSMGMSGDFDVAIRHGATLVRIGTSIFGPRHAAVPDETPPGEKP